MRSTIFLTGSLLLLSAGVYAQNSPNMPSGNVGINNGGVTAPVPLQVIGQASLGDMYDPTLYGLVQIVRPANQPDNKFHLSFIRNGASISGMGYMPNSNTIGIWHSNTNAGTPAIAITPDQKVGINKVTPYERLTIGTSAGDIFIGDILYAGYNGIGMNGSIDWADYNLLSSSSDNNLYINRPNNAGIYFRMHNNNQMTIAANGNLGIGPGFNPQFKVDIETNNPNDGINIRYNASGFTKFHANSLQVEAYNPITKAGDAGIIFGGGPAADNHTFGFVIAPWSSSESGIRINADGRVGIGTSAGTSGYKLFVAEGIRTRKVKVDAQTWADFVFEEDYSLRSLDKVEQFIKQNKHLPDVPSAAEVKKEGIDLGDNQAVLLRKIEELTLYILQLKKELNTQQARIDSLEIKTNK